MARLWTVRARNMVVAQAGIEFRMIQAAFTIQCWTDAAAIETVAESLCSMNHAQRSAIRVIHLGPVEVIMGGALILREVMRQTQSKDIIVSERDLLDGIAASMA